MRRYMTREVQASVLPSNLYSRELVWEWLTYWNWSACCSQQKVDEVINVDDIIRHCAIYKGWVDFIIE